VCRSFYEYVVVSFEFVGCVEVVDVVGVVLYMVKFYFDKFVEEGLFIIEFWWFIGCIGFGVGWFVKLYWCSEC